ncbi:MAG TPA: hypothetical protein VIN62_03705 [Candidatus Cryosericum sp.]|nr:hypothetical protein [Candidatus Cryosericum sp.]
MSNDREQSRTTRRAGLRNDVLGITTEVAWTGILILVGYFVSRLFFLGR